MSKKSQERLEEEFLKKQKFAKRLREAKAIRRLRNKDIVERAKEFGESISVSQVSQCMKGRLLPTKERLLLWAKILRVHPYWLEGYGDDNQIMDLPTEQEQLENLEELSKLFMKLNPERQKLLIALAKELTFALENPIYILTETEK